MALKRFAFPIFLLGSALLSMGPLFVRLADVGAVQSAFWRLALGAPVLLILARLMPGAPTADAPKRGRLWPWIVAAGALFAADLATWHLGIKRTSLANAALLANGAAFFLPVYGYVAARHWPKGQAVAAMLLALVGAVLLMGMSAQLGARNLAGDILCVTAALCYTAYLVIMDRVRARLAVWPALAVSTLVSALVLLPVAYWSNGAFWPRDWTPILCLTLASQVLGQGLTIFALPYISPLAAGIGLLIQPVLTTLMGIGVLGERLRPLEMLGMVLILAALLLVRLPIRGRMPGAGSVPPRE